MDGLGSLGLDVCIRNNLSDAGSGSLSIGTLQYTGDIAEIVVWKGVALTTADVANITATLQAF